MPGTLYDAFECIDLCLCDMDIFCVLSCATCGPNTIMNYLETLYFRLCTAPGCNAQFRLGVPTQTLISASVSLLIHPKKNKRKNAKYQKQFFLKNKIQRHQVVTSLLTENYFHQLPNAGYPFLCTWLRHLNHPQHCSPLLVHQPKSRPKSKPK